MRNGAPVQLSISKSKNSKSFYITKSFRDPKTKKCTSKVVKRLGTEAELRAKLGEGADIAEWGRGLARRMTAEERAGRLPVTLELNPAKETARGERRLFSGGGVFVDAACSKLGLREICKEIQGRRKFDFDLPAITQALVAGRVIEPASKRATCEFAKGCVGCEPFKAHQVYRALEVLAKECDLIQERLYKNSKRALGRRDKILYYDCTNFFFEIGEEDDFRRYGASKEHRPNPIVQMGLFMDADGMPLAFDVFPGNRSEQTSMTPLEEKIVGEFGCAKFVACTDAGLSSLANRRFNSRGQRQFVTTQSVRKLKGHLKAWALDPAGWRARGAEGVFDLAEVCATYDAADADKGIRNRLRGLVFYKTRMAKEKDAESQGGFFEQRLVVTFSLKHRDHQRKVRQGQLDRALEAIGRDAGRLDRKGANDFRRLCKRQALTGDGEVARSVVWSIDEAKVAEEGRYDGFYALATSLADEDDVEGVLQVNAQRWQIEECFRIMKDEMRARPVYLSREDRIRAHFLICFIALLAYRVIEREVGGARTCDEVIDALRDIRFLEIRGVGWVPAFTRTELTDALCRAFSIDVNTEIVPNKRMRKILKEIRKG